MPMMPFTSIRGVWALGAFVLGIPLAGASHDTVDPQDACTDSFQECVETPPVSAHDQGDHAWESIGEWRAYVAERPGEAWRFLDREVYPCIPLPPFQTYKYGHHPYDNGCLTYDVWDLLFRGG